MRKEVLYAIIFGIILGGIVLFGINLANKSVTNLESGSDTTPGQDLSTTPTPVTTKKNFEITSPPNHAVIGDKTVSLTGTTTPNGHLTIVSELDDLIITSSPEGTFSAQVNLVAGENTLTVTNLLEDNTTSSQFITVIQATTTE